MAQEGDDRLALPVPPPPRPAARRQAIDAALRKFDGIEEPAARRRPSLPWWSAMNRRPPGALVAAAIIALVSIPAIQIALRDGPASEVAGESNAAAPDRLITANEPHEEAGELAEAAEPSRPAASSSVVQPGEADEEGTGFTSTDAEQKARVAPPDRMMAAPAPPALVAAPPPPPPPPPAPARRAAEPEAQSEAAERAEGADAAADAAGSIVVTGSRIRKSNMESASPMTVVDPFGDFLTRLQQAIENNDRMAVARLVALPLHVRVGGERRTYSSSRAIYNDYDLIFTPAVRIEATGLHPLTLQSRDGGRLKGGGRIWFGCGKRRCSSADGIRIRQINP